jgi:ribonuclease HI/predicted  nucleic acid-binding Zn-ribbon protein
MSSDPILIELAREDAHLFQLRRQVATLPKRIDDLDDEKRRVQRQLEECEAVYQKQEKARRKLELELQEVRQRRAKSESRQSSLTSTDQYQALMREIATQDQRIDELESLVLEAMERSEQALKRRDTESIRWQTELKRLEALQVQLRQDLASAHSTVEEQSARRDAAVQKVEPQTRSLYERVLRAKKDAAIARVNDRTCPADVPGMWPYPRLGPRYALTSNSPESSGAIDPSLEYTLYCDGASRGNPGRAAIGFVLVDPVGEERLAHGEVLGDRITNNVAEYTALLRGLEAAAAAGVRRLLVRLDSELAVRQLRGEYKVRNPGLRPLFEAAQELQARFESFRIKHVRREENQRADALANAALDA